jgi:hypothetical protein
MNTFSEAVCLYMQQGRKGANQDVMVIWEVSYRHYTPYLCLDAAILEHMHCVLVMFSCLFVCYMALFIKHLYMLLCTIVNY